MRALIRLLLLLCLFVAAALPARTARATTPTPPAPAADGLLAPEDVDEDALFPSQARASRWFPPDERYDYSEVSERRFILIHQDRQTIYLFQNGEVVRIIPVSTGLPGKRTETKPWSGRVGVYWGTFFAYDVYADEAWHLFKDDGNILIHSAPYILDDEGNKVYQELEGLGVRPMSHGCIRIPPDDAAWLTGWGPQGAPVLITPLSAGVYG